MDFILININELKEKYLTGYSLRNLAKEYNTSKTTIKNKLIKAGITEFRKTNKSHKTEKRLISHNIEQIKVQEFIKKSKFKFGNKFEYLEESYTNYNKPVQIICPEHGKIEITPTTHLNNQYGCILCSKEYKRQEYQQKYLKILKEKYKDYQYPNFKFTHLKQTIEVICPKHGKFTINLKRHLNGNKCKKCANELLKSNTEEFIEKSAQIHGENYDYSDSNYISSKEYLIIKCKAHGEFLQRPNNHLNGHGCPICAKECLTSKAQQEITEFINQLGFKTVSNTRTVINPLELDIYLPDQNFAIEYNGLFWHSYDKPETKEEKYKHYNKNEKCINKNIKLIQIFENEWQQNKEIIQSIIKSKLGCTNRIYARKCGISEISSKEFKEFCINNHIQGSVNSKIKYALMYNGMIVSVIGFNKHKKYEWEITRFCNLLNTTVVGGASKLLKYFIKVNDPENILTFADRRYSDGNVYRKLGFKLHSITSPGYFYTDLKNVYNRVNFQKHKLNDKLKKFNPLYSESQNMFNNGYRRIWDCGHYKFLYQI
jgi:hypothetical protein